MVLLSPQLYLPRTSFLTAGDLPFWWHMGLGLSHVSAAQHHGGESSSALLLPGALQHRGEGLPFLQALAAAPLPASSFWDKDAQTTPLPREHQERRVPREGGSWAEDWHCYSSTSRRRGRAAPSLLCKLNHSPGFSFMALSHLLAVHQL